MAPNTVRGKQQADNRQLRVFGCRYNATDTGNPLWCADGGGGEEEGAGAGKELWEGIGGERPPRNARNLESASRAAQGVPPSCCCCAGEAVAASRGVAKASALDLAQTLT